LNVQTGQSDIQPGNFNDHMTKVCPKEMINCSASDIKCQWSGPRNQLQNHLNKCSYKKLRPVKRHFSRTDSWIVVLDNDHGELPPFLFLIYIYMIILPSSPSKI
jgi:hypothetical protein